MTNKKNTNHKQAHLFPIISSFFVIGLLALLATTQIQYNRTVIYIVVAIYIISNTLYAKHEGTLSIKRFLEFLAPASLAGYVAITYLI